MCVHSHRWQHTGLKLIQADVPVATPTSIGVHASHMVPQGLVSMTAAGNDILQGSGLHAYQLCFVNVRTEELCILMQACSNCGSCKLLSLHAGHLVRPGPRQLSGRPCRGAGQAARAAAAGDACGAADDAGHVILR